MAVRVREIICISLKSLKNDKPHRQADILGNHFNNLRCRTTRAFYDVTMSYLKLELRYETSSCLNNDNIKPLTQSLQSTLLLIEWNIKLAIPYGFLLKVKKKYREHLIKVI